MKKEIKPIELWLSQLFSTSDVIPSTAQKTYFTHHYHGHPKQSLFASLFATTKESVAGSGLGNEKLINRVYADEPVAARASPYCSGKGAKFSGELIVRNNYQHTAHSKTFRLARKDGQPFHFLPGQYITLALDIAGQRYKRSYSLSSSPTNTSIFDITVKRDGNGGVVSNWLLAELNIGDSLLASGPYGKFTYTQPLPKKVLFLAAGSGIAPIMSMLRWLCETETSVDVVLLLSVKSRYDIIFRDELEFIQSRHQNVKLLLTLTHEPTGITGWQSYRGRINQQLLAETVPDLSERSVYLCGPSAFMDNCLDYLNNLGLPLGQLRYESFTVNRPTLATTLSSTARSSEQPSPQKRASFRINFAKTGLSVTTDGSMSLLELAEQFEVRVDADCRQGECGICMVKLRSGQVEMTDVAEIAEIDKQQGWLYSCCAYPVSDVVLEI